MKISPDVIETLKKSKEIIENNEISYKGFSCQRLCQMISTMIVSEEIDEFAFEAQMELIEQATSKYTSKERFLIDDSLYNAIIEWKNRLETRIEEVKNRIELAKSDNKDCSSDEQYLIHLYYHRKKINELTKYL